MTELSYKEDNGIRGLYIKADIILNPEIESHKELIHGIRHNLINGFSIGFGDIVERYDTEKQVNVIESLTLYEISLVDIPDNPLTVRKMFDMIKSEKNLEEDVARESGDGEVVDDKVEDVVEAKDTEEVTEQKEETQEVVAENANEVIDVKVETQEKSLKQDNSLGDMLTDAIRLKLGIQEDTQERVYVCCIYTNQCIYNHYNYSLDTGFDKYFRI